MWVYPITSKLKGLRRSFPLLVLGILYPPPPLYSHVLHHIHYTTTWSLGLTLCLHFLEGELTDCLDKAKNVRVRVAHNSLMMRCSPRELQGFSGSINGLMYILPSRERNSSLWGWTLPRQLLGHKYMGRAVMLLQSISAIKFLKFQPVVILALWSNDPFFRIGATPQRTKTALTKRE